MRSCWPLRQARTFRPHLHTASCTVCSGVTQPPPHTTPTVPTSSSNIIRPSSSPVIPKGANSSHRLPHHDTHASVEEHRRRGLLAWQEQFRSRTGPTPTQLEGHWAAFHNSDVELTDDIVKGAVEYLDSFCTHSVEGGAQAPTPAEKGSRLVLPRVVRLPLDVPMTVGGTQAHPLPTSSTSSSDNDFVLMVKKALGDDAAAVRKQVSFQNALLDFQRVCDGVGLRFFLACGTALGARREGFFIAHDTDVDVGVFLEDLMALGQTAQQLTHGESSEASMLGDAVLLLLNHLAMDDAGFTCFDVCGEVARGLELRLLHRASGVRVDVNVYYPPITPEDDSLVAAQGAFVWASSFYEEAAQRQHHMYRYRHRPFGEHLERMRFCATDSLASSEAGFLVPPVSYLEESYGDDWATPKTFTYVEGLAGQFRNIIPE